MDRIFMSVVIPCFNAGARISRLLEQLSCQTLPRQSYEILAVDDGSTDDTAQQIGQFSDVTLLQQPRSGPGAARNLGTRKARGAYVLYLDSDVEAPPHLLATHLAYHQAHPEIAATGGSVVPHEKLPLGSWSLVDHLSSWFNAHPRAVYRQPPEYLPSLNFCIDRQVVWEERGISWEAGLGYTGEDVIYCHTLRQHDLQLCFVPEAVVQHADRTTCRDHFRHVYRWGYHAPFVRGQLAGLRYGFLFPRRLGLQLFTLPLIIGGYTCLVWKSWLPARPLAATVALPQILAGRCAYAWGVFRGALARRRPAGDQALVAVRGELRG